jgi:broad specificity phosphatase PhoE
MLTLVLTRHGLTDRSIPEQHLGQRIDVSLNEAGERQAEALATRLRTVHVDRVITSPLFRARETAAILARALVGEGPIEADPRLKEMDYGAWEGKTYEEIDAVDAEYRARWVASPAALPCPQGESGDDVARRVREFLEELTASVRPEAVANGEGSGSGGAVPTSTWTPGTPGGVETGTTVVAVGHSSTNRVLMCVALGIPVREYRQRFVQGQGNLTVLRFADDAGPADAQLLLANDLAHLREPGEPPWG